MQGPVWDFEDADLIMDMGGNIGIDSDGHMMTNMGGGMAMDMETGDLHIVSEWNNDNTSSNCCWDDAEDD